MFQINLKILKCLHALNKNLFIFLYIFFFSWGPGWGGGAYQHFKALCNNYWHRKVKNKDHNLYFKILQRLQEPSRSKYFKMTTATHVSFFYFCPKNQRLKRIITQVAILHLTFVFAKYFYVHTQTCILHITMNGCLTDFMLSDPAFVAQHNF